MIKKEFSTPLLPKALIYLASPKYLMHINNVPGYFLRFSNGDEDTYIFQPEEIDDKKITMNERKSSRRKIIQHVILNTDAVFTSAVSNNGTGIQKFKQDIEKLLLKCYDSSMADVPVIFDMYIDSLNQSEYLDLIKRLKKDKRNDSEEMRSLERGGFVVTLDSIKYFYNHFENKFISFDDDNEASAREDEKIRNELKLITLNKKLSYTGFSDLKNSELVVKLKTERGKSSGSICSQTSTFSIQKLRELIIQYKPFKFNIESSTYLSKGELCKVYEYMLRLNDRFLRYPYYRHLTDLNKK
jgi:hypothetical protein